MASMDQFGLDVGIYGPLAEPETITTLARFAEDAGFHSIWLADHVAFPAEIASKYPFSQSGKFPAPTSGPLLEPIAAMGVLAGATTRLRIGTAVLDSPYFALRGKATDEYLEIFKKLSAGGEVGFEGETYSFKPVHSVPGSFQRPHPPVLIGGVSNPALHRVARNDGWLATALGPEQMPERLAALKRICGEQGRNFDDLETVYKLFIAPGEPKTGVYGQREMGSGSPQQIVDDLKSVLDSGFERVIVRYRGDSAAAQMEQMERFAADIVPKL